MSESGSAPVETNTKERWARHWDALASDLRAWVELKITLVEINLWERFKWELFTRGLPGLLLAAAALFLLVGAALGLGQVLGHPAWGFAAISGILGAVAGLLHRYRVSRSRRPSRRPWEKP